MIRFRFVDQDSFEVDPGRYASALGEDGIAAYRKAVAAHPADDSFAARYPRERLAVLDGDVDAIVKLLGGDLSTPSRFVRIAAAMSELGRDGETLAWTARGIAETQPTAGRPPTCTTWRAPCTPSAGSRSTCSRSTSGCQLSQPRALCGPPPTRSTPGRSSAMPPERRCKEPTCARSSTPSSATAPTASPGTQPQPLRATRSGLTSGCASPRVVRPKRPPTRSRSTSGSLTRFSKGPIGGHTRRPCESSSALEQRRKVRTR
jgi:hypothetical protein